MEVAGLSLAVLAEVRLLVLSLKDRWQRYRDGPQRFALVERAVIHLVSLDNEIEAVVKTNPAALPSATEHIFNETVGDVKEDIVLFRDAIEDYCTRAFGGSSIAGAV